MDSEIVSFHSNINTVTLDLTIDMFNRYFLLINHTVTVINFRKMKISYSLLS